MRRREHGKCIAAWILSAAMVLSNSSFAVLAEEATEEAAVVTAVLEEAPEAEAPSEETAEEEESLLGISEEENLEEEQTDGDAAEAVEDDQEAAAAEAIEEDEQIIGDTCEEETVEEAFVASVAEGEEQGQYSLAINAPYGNSGVTWIYFNKTIYLGLEAEAPDDAKDIRFEWSCVDFDNMNGKEKGGESQYISGNEVETGVYAITGTELTPVDETGVHQFAEYAIVRAEMYAGEAEEAVASAEIAVFVSEPQYYYNEPLSGSGENEMLPGWQRDFRMDCVADDFIPEEGIWPGANLPVDITDVKVTASGWWDDENECVADDGQERLEVWDNGDGNWTIRAMDGESYGCVELTYTYTDKLTGEERTGSCVVFINGDYYELGLNNPEGTDDMLTNSQKVIGSDLSHSWCYGEDQGYEFLEDYSLKILTGDDGSDRYDTGLVKAEVTEDGKGIRVSSKENAGDTYIPVRASFYVDGEERWVESWIYVNVQESYYNILPVSLDVNPAIGEELDLSRIGLQVWQYAAGAEEGTDVTGEADIRIRLENYDDNVWSVKEITEDDDLLPALTRMGNWGTSITLVAEGADEEGNWNELTRREFWFDDLDYSVWFNEEGITDPGNNRTIVFTNDTLDLSLNTENLDDKGDAASIQWSVYKGWDEEKGDYGEEIYTGFVGEDGRVTLDGAELVKQADRDENENIQDVVVVARVMVNGEELWRTDVWVEIAEAEQSLEWSKPMNMLQGDNIWVGANDLSCWLRNKDYPYGESIGAVITGIEVVQGYQWDAEADEEVPVETSVVGVERQDEGWLLNGDDFGWAKLKVAYTLDGDEASCEEIVEIYVSGDIWYLDWDFRKGDDEIVAGGMTEIENVILRHDYIDWENDGERIYGKETDYACLSVQWDDLDEDGIPYPTYDPNMVTVEVLEDAKSLRITANHEEGGTDFWIRAMMPVTDENGNEILDDEGNVKLEEICGDNIHVNITDSCEHSWKKVNEVAATCETNGSVTFKCEWCGEEEIETLAALGHKPGAWTVTKEATCTAAGEQVQKCTVCNKIVDTKPISALGHSYGAWTQATSATVFAAATETRKCTRCGTVEKRSTGTALSAYAKLTASSVKMQVKQKTSAFKVTGMAAGDYVKSWKSSNTKVLKVSGKSNGTCKLTAQKKTGKATLTITFASGLKKTVKVTVQKKKVTTTKISGVPKKIALKVKKSTTLKPSFTPFDTQDKVTYKSSNKKVATVSSKGKITAKKKGKAVITVTSGKKKVKCTVTVK